MNDNIKNNENLNENIQSDINIPSENGTTYWESGELQNSFYAASQPSEDNTADFSQKIQDYTYEAFKRDQYEIKQNKKFGKKPLITAIIVVFLLLVATATAYAFNSTFQNTINLLIKSPKEYYSYIENKSVGRAVDKSIAYMKMTNSNDNMATETTVNISYDKDTVNSMLMLLANMSISDFESLIGISLDSIGFDVTSAKSENEIYQKIGFNLNDIDIISAELFMDLLANEILLQLPDLSPDYLRIALDMGEYGVDDVDLDNYNKITNLLTSDSTGDFLKRYTAIITDEIDDVELAKGESLTVGDLTIKSNLLTLYFFPETMNDISTRVLEEARDDEYILELLPIFDLTKDEYNKKLDAALENAKQTYESMPNDKAIFVMKVYVGSDGQILGRTLEPSDNNTNNGTLEIFNIRQDDKGAYDISLKGNNGNHILKVTGSHTIADKAYTGAAKIMMTTDKGESTEIDIEYDELKTVIKDKRIYSYGEISFSTSSMLGFDLVIEYDAKDDEQLSTIKLNMGSSSLVTLDTSVKYLEDYTIPKRDGNAKVYDSLTESGDYYNSFDTDKYLSDLSDRLGIDLNSILGYFLPSY